MIDERFLKGDDVVCSTLILLYIKLDLFYKKI